MSPMALTSSLPLQKSAIGIEYGCTVQKSAIGIEYGCTVQKSAIGIEYGCTVQKSAIGIEYGCTVQKSAIGIEFLLGTSRGFLSRGGHGLHSVHLCVARWGGQVGSSETADAPVHFLELPGIGKEKGAAVIMGA
ncbi:hypothetical protein LTR53_009334 [Teratosphaeriaceae sp. CCFEE 6253]|nr:hypothetical protein LTR53_009334 [Teratosphaeriaceae sp. CCFEE 6253]